MDDDKLKSSQQIAHDMLRDYLHARRLRVTPERCAILDAIFDIEGHFTIETVSNRLEEQRFHVSMATLYSSLDMFVDVGIVNRYYFGSAVRYERCIGTEPHFHRICKECGQVQDFRNDRWLHTMEQTTLRGFKPDYYQFYIYGTCSKCLRRKNKKTVKK